MSFWSNLFRRQDPGDNEWKAIMAKAMAFLDVEELQNRSFPESFRAMLHSDAVDRVANGFGMYGRDLNNPIPVNGPIGEVLFLSSLVTAGGAPILFHRLGSIGTVDVFETVGMDGERWDLLYLSMYFPAKSKEVPAGFRKASKDEVGSRSFRGTNMRCDDFPSGIYPLAMSASTTLVGIGLADPRIKECAALRAARPSSHLEFLRTMSLDGSQTKV